MGAFYRFRRTLEANKFGIFTTIFGAVISSIVTLIYSSVKGATNTVIYVTKETAKRVGPHLPTIAAFTIGAGIKLSETLLWLSNHIISFLIGCVMVSISLYKIYGEESVFPIFAIWSFAMAMGLVFLGYVGRFMSYLPF